MTIAAVLLGILAAVLGVVIIEKKRSAGTLTYPLWQGNLLIPWGALVLLFIVVVGGLNLPAALGLARRGVPVPGVIVRQEGRDQYCLTTYRYSAQGKDYTGTDSICGLKPGSGHRVYYDPSSPERSALYPPKEALKNELVAIVLIAVCLPTLIVLWLMMTHVIGRRKKA